MADTSTPIYIILDKYDENNTSIFYFSPYNYVKKNTSSKQNMRVVDTKFLSDTSCFIPINHSTQFDTNYCVIESHDGVIYISMKKNIYVNKHLICKIIVEIGKCWYEFYCVIN